MSRKRIQRKNPWQPTPAPDILQSRPFSNGLGPRESRLPTTNDILQTRPFSPRDKDISTPKDTRSFEEKMKGAEFRYNGVSIPAVQREEVEEENSQEQAEGETSAANISVFTPSTPPLENSILSPFSLLKTDGLGEQETVQREEVSVGDEEKEGFEVGIQKQHLQASPDDGTIQRLCAECEGELADKEEKEPIQAKLTVGEPGDKYEQEADAVAAQVVEKINAPQTQEPVQRQSELGGASVPNITVMRRGESGIGGESTVTEDVEQGIQQAKGGGQGLDEFVRQPMEGAFGADFSGVKIHTDAQSDQLNRSIQAKAFTTGQDIFFKQGEYNPGSRGGQELLAHELTHVVQQTGAVQRDTIQCSSLDDFSDPKNPQHDPSRLSDSQIQATDEYQRLQQRFFPQQSPNPTSVQELVLACRLALRYLREHQVSISPQQLEGFFSQARHQLGAMQGVSSLENNLHWVPFNSPDAANNPAALQSEFGRWLLANGSEPNSTSGRMNCWEVILFGAYRQGMTTKARLEQIYQLAVQNHRQTGASVGATVETQLRASQEYTLDPQNPNTPQPLSGDMVVFREARVHAAISLGTVDANGDHEILSLWTPNGGTVERTTIERLMQQASERPIKFWSVRW
ncbi:eCIS core domain-containing protein [Limnofasciculus baicalensis]|uniref:DUF4157 domain-containing protein n=1 Tax=Limnofasciculus baicalensis BBK-W-15 TaxID=2699891 RepID=A0AAE3KLZ1_9CYAN|nr:DUF4157 domain-containing protein [Limnofasciculus baicalensis]MCP2729015.1 DUF4157 domain-containing protein [Limnofasciculus baicalensis BBK-W-15]